MKKIQPCKQAATEVANTASSKPTTEPPYSVIEHICPPIFATKNNEDLKLAFMRIFKRDYELN